ncbi:unnamed protein product (mitochondrion) [Plasmodiophora brassicae]|uniref:Coatomer subunit delta n=1 Tax=Plasmodiophora brassicae TaxID=37360 RepID=A0A3P3Y8P1_PLABS|nr:unnamed protein product [Plasmodiophora brassicae]
MMIVSARCYSFRTGRCGISPRSFRGCGLAVCSSRRAIFLQGIRDCEGPTAMVVLSAAVVTKTGKVLVARQFIAMSKLRIEGLLSAFPKLVGSGGEHTFIETENVRYIYQPIELLYVLIITNKQSNIMEDLETLRLVAKLVPEFCHGHDEQAVSSNAFQLVFALDEVISSGYRENVSLQQVRTFTEMDSHEAKLQKIIKASKEDDARSKMKQRAAEIEKHKQKMATIQTGRGMGGGGYSSGDYLSGSGPPDYSHSRIEPTNLSRAQREQKGAVGLRLGQALGGASRQGDQFFAQLATEEHLAPVQSPPGQPLLSRPAASAAPEPAEIVDGVLVSIEEVITVHCERDGTLKQLEAVGTVKLTVGNPDYARIRLHVGALASAPKGTRFQPHPKMDKGAWTSSQILALKESDKGFPIGSSNAAPILKWKLSTSDSSFLPFSVTFWPSQENGRTVVTAEYQAESDRITLQDVRIVITTPPPQVSQCDGDYVYDNASRSLVWSIGNVEPDATGTMEWKTDPVDPDSLFPLRVQFTSQQTIAGIGVDQITMADAPDQAVEYDTRTSLTVQSFTLE